MIILLYLFWFLVLVLYICQRFRKISKKLYIAIKALREISSTNHDMNKLVYIAIKALKDIDNIK